MVVRVVRGHHRGLPLFPACLRAVSWSKVASRPPAARKAINLANKESHLVAWLDSNPFPFRRVSACPLDALRGEINVETKSNLVERGEFRGEFVDCWTGSRKCDAFYGYDKRSWTAFFLLRVHTGISWWKICERVQWKRVHIYEQLYLHDVSTFVYFRSCPVSNGFEKLSVKHVYLNFLTDVAISIHKCILYNPFKSNNIQMWMILKNVGRHFERECIMYCNFFIRHLKNILIIWILYKNFII